MNRWIRSPRWFSTWLIVLGALLGTSAAVAGGQVFLNWNACVGDPQATSTLTSSCNSQTDAQNLVLAFRPDAPVDSVIAVEIVLDIRFGSGSIPAWWRFDPEGCRAGAAALSSVPLLAGNCVDWWNLDLLPGFLYLIGQPWERADQARIVLSLALPGNEPARHLDAGTTYFAGSLMIANQGTAGCAGCSQPACIVFNSILLGRTPGQPGADPVMATPAAANGNWTTWQGGAGCDLVPTRPRTWGQLKNLYR